MNTLRKTAFRASLAMLVLGVMSSIGMAQFATEATIRETVRRIQTRTDNLQRAVQNASDRGNYRAEDLNRLILDFESATNQLDRRLSNRRTASSDARMVLDRAAQIDSFFVNNRIGAGTNREWQALRADLDQLAGYYNLTAQWGTGSGSGTGGSNDYNLNDAQMRQLIQRINTRSATFSRNLRNDLNRVYRDDRNSADEARRQLSAFESALVQLRNRVNSRQSSSSDVRNLLDPAAFLNTY
ncbi:MAG TPA: hypothetical protein VFS77_11245, partial [Pyrinomonadaceae bacterium]|nr:hypothetical protein [Pyrinomonadaceae bacterium]